MIKLLSLLSIFLTLATPEEPQVGFVEKTGEYVPMELKFRDESGKEVRLSEIVKRPVLLTLVYYECPGICTPLLSGVADVINRTNMTLGKDFDVLTVSFNPADKPSLAEEKKRNYLQVLKRNRIPEGWRFLTGDRESIAQLTRAVGFRYKEEDGEYIHPAGVIVLSEKGRIIRYLHGIEFLPLDIKLSIADAYEDRPAPPLIRLARLCYRYDPGGRRYVLNLLSIFAAGSILVAGLFFAVLVIKNNKRRSEQ